MSTETANQTHLAFHLTGTRSGSGLEPVNTSGFDLRPALLARYRDLTLLRYDFPIVLVSGGDGLGVVRALSGVIDDLLREVAHSEDADRVTKYVLRLEREMRTLVAHEGGGLLSTLWDQAARRMGTSTDAGLALSLGLSRARTALGVDGEVVDCQASMPARLFTHVWRAVQDEKSRRFRAEAGTLVQQLSDILRADFARSEAGRTPQQLKAAVGALYEDAFDFDVLSRTLATAGPKDTLPDSRRRRIRAILEVLESQPFFPAPGGSETPGRPGAAFGFVFETCGAALDAYRARLARMTEVAKVVAMAELESGGEYRESKHDAFFRDFTPASLAAQDLAVFPDYLVCANSATMDPAEHVRLLEILAEGLPMKVLVQFDDLVDESRGGGAQLNFGARSRQLTNMAIGLNDAYVLQASASHLLQAKGQIVAGLRYPGPTLFTVFSGATGKGGDLPPYLAAAAAMESRAFPAFTYDPSAGSDWASRFSVDDNPQADEDWPIQSFAYEDDGHQRVAERVAFTLVDFLACDRRYAPHLARVPREAWNGHMVSVADSISADRKGRLDHVPYLVMVDGRNMLQRVLVDEKLLREARRCREAWHSLQELGGIHNSHAARMLARERQARDAQDRREAEARAHESKPAAPPTLSQAQTTITSEAPAPAESQAERSADEAYIETPRCTTCNECTQVNPNMFAYNENRQAFIKNPDAGTYRQLVEAAESCQVSIIHPGKPRNPHEPDLEELIKRAEPFR